MPYDVLAFNKIIAASTGPVMGEWAGHVRGAPIRHSFLLEASVSLRYEMSVVEPMDCGAGLPEMDGL